MTSDSGWSDQADSRKSSAPGKMGCGVTCVDNMLTRSFYKLGVQIGHTPGYFLIVPVLLTLLFITGYQRINYQMDPEYLFSPEKGPGKTERNIVETYFKMNYTSRFNPTRITRPGRFGRVIVIPKHGSDMLSVEAWKELRTLDGIIKNATIVFGEDNMKYTYDDICARWVDHCFENDILNLDFIMPEVVNKTLNLTFPIMFNPVTWDAHTFPVYFGGTVVNDDGIILTVPSLQLAYFVNADTKAQDARGAVWEEAFLAAVGAAEDSGMFKYISTARFASRTLDIELEKNTQGVVPYFGSTFVIMALFSALTCMMVDWVRSKPLLGLLGNVSAAMATVAGFGLAMYCGIDFIGINLVSPLLMCSIGIDDTFVMLAAWRRTPVTMSVPERMGHTMSDAAVSITITSVTDMVSLWIGMLSPFPSIQIFCLYSSFAVGLIFLWHITFFAACMVIAGYAEAGNRHSLLCIKVKPVSLTGKKSCFYKVFCSGGINPKDPDNPRDNKENALMAFFRDSVAWCVNQWPFKVMVLAVFVAYIGGAIYGLTTLQEGLQRRKLSRADSYSIEFYDREDFYFREFPYRMQVILAGELNYSDPLVQEQVENLTRTFEASPYISSPLYTESWLRSFVSYVKRNQDYLNVSIDTEDSFIKTLNEAYDQPDVYETKDLPEADQNADIIEEESESIEQLHISASTALSKFKDKALDATNIDFSDRLSKRIRTGYSARSGDWELVGDGEKETPLQKYQRLQCEMKELLEEVTDLKESAKDESSKQPCTALSKQVETLVKQLTELRLEEKLGTDLITSLGDPQGAQFKKLLSQLEQLQGAATKRAVAEKGAGEGDNASQVTFQLSLRPNHAQLTQTSRLAQLEQRLARLEQVVGAAPDKLSRLGGSERSLLASAQYLSSRAALLDTAQLDSAGSRISSLLVKLDQVAEKTTAITGSSDPERDKKINELYELAKKAEHLSQVLPQALDRMQALQNLHQQGGEFSKSVSEMESIQVQLMAKMRANADLVTGVEENLKSSLTTIRADMESLDTRVKALAANK